MAWTPLSFPFGSVLTSAKQTQLYDNITALANGDSGAPAIQNAAMGTDAIHQAEIKSTTASQSIAISASGANYITLTGASWAFNCYWRTTDAGASLHRVYPVYKTSTNSDRVGFVNGSGSSVTFYTYHRYVQASPPYNLGDGDIPQFIYALVENGTGKVIATYSAEDPPWAYHGISAINPRKIIKEGGKTYILEKDLQGRTTASEIAKGGRALEQLIEDAYAVEETLVELDMTRKLLGKDTIPHPWVPELSDLDLNNYSIVLLDPVNDQLLKMSEMISSGELDISSMLHNGDIIIDNIPLIRSVPDGVKAHGFRIR